MSDIKNWSQSAAGNTSAAPDGWPEGMPPSGVNDTGRENMAAIRRQMQDCEWFDWGHAPSRTGATTFKVAGDKTSIYTNNRRLKMSDGSSTFYGRVTSSSYGTETTVTVSASGSLTTSLSAVAISIINPAYNSLPTNMAASLSSLTVSGTTSLSATSITGNLSITGAVQANINMNSKKLTSLAAGSTAGDSVRYEQVALLTGNNTFSGTNTFSTTNTFQSTVTITNSASQFVAQKLYSTNGDANPGPYIDLYRTGGSQAASDAIGIIRFIGEDTAVATDVYGTIICYVLDPTAGSEDGTIYLQTLAAGTNGTRLVVAQGVHGPGTTGGDKGTNTLNFSAIYDDGVQIFPLGSTISTPSISSGTNYQNTSGLYEIIYCSIDSTSTPITVYCDSSATPTTVVGSIRCVANVEGSHTLIVPPGYYYKYTLSGSPSFRKMGA